jgi:methionyl-tRNA formyltransferase
MNRVFILLNSHSDFNNYNELDYYLSDCWVDIGTTIPVSPNDYNIIVAWNYRKIIKSIPIPNNIIIFHSSNLPHGKGWAPIYHSIASENFFYTITGILASLRVDSGDIVVRAKFKIKPEYIAKDIRNFDNQISLLLVKKIIEKFDEGPIKGIKQCGASSYNERRYPSDNEINIQDSFTSLIPHLRACEDNAPPYFYYNNIRYNVSINPDFSVDTLIPKDLNINFAID